MNEKLIAKLQDLMCMALESEHKPKTINISYGGDHIDVMLVTFPIPKYFKVTPEEIIASEPWKFIAVSTCPEYHQYQPLTGNTTRIEQV